MNLTTVFLLAVCISANANGFSQNINLSERNTSLKKVFRKINQQTSYTFVYTESLLKKSKVVSITVQNVTLEQALEICFREQPLTYTIFNKMVVIKEKADAPQKENTFTPVPIPPYLEIRGRITDDKGEPLQGASIVVKGKEKGVQSDENGNFSINAEAGSVLSISYVGFQTTEIKIGTQTAISVKLNPSVNTGTEIVITALGIKKEKKALAYSVSEIKGDDLTQSRTANIANSLAGKVAGLNISTPASGANGASRIVIRGNGSISGNNQPLIVVDGIPINNDATTLGPVVSTSNGDFQGYDKGDGISSLNPDEIETISVLKGATAAALYGSRASNGAILITTKSAKAGKGIGVDVNFNATAESLLINDLNLQKEYGHGTGGIKPSTVAQAKAGRFSWGGKLDGSDAMFYDGVTRPYVAQDNNFNDFYNTGRSLTSSVALSGGGSENVRYRVSYSNLDYKGILPTNTLKRNNFSINLTSNLAKQLSIAVNAKYIKEKNHNRPRLNGESGSTTFGILALPSTIPLSVLREKKYDANGFDNPWNDNLFTINPYYGVEDFKEDDDKNRLIGVIEPKFQLTDWLYIKARLGMDYFNYNEQEITPYGFAAQTRGALTQRKRTFGEYNTDIMVGVNKKLTTDIYLSAVAGTNYMKQVTDAQDFSASNSFNIPFFYDISNIDPASRILSQAHIEKRISSVYGSAELSYKGFLYLNGAARNDWFSTLAPGKNSILYPSVGLSFVVSEALKLPALFNYFKLRGSWAQAGGDTDPYNLTLTYALNGSNLGSPIGQINGTRVPNANLQPLTSTTSEFGFETKMLKNRLTADFTVYNRKTTNDIVAATISSTSGYNTALFNVGAISNKGIELLLGGTPFKNNNFSWDVSFNVGYNKSKVLSLYGNLTTLRLDQGRYGASFIHQDVGLPYGQIKGYDFKRDAAGNIVNDVNGIPVQGNIINFGSGVSPAQIGFSNTFTYKHFSLDILIDSKFGGYIYSGTNAFSYRFGLAPETLQGREGGIVGPGVDPAGNKNTKTATAQAYWGGLFNRIAIINVFKSDFIKVRQVILDYNFPVARLGKTHIKGISVGLVANNLAILMKKTPNFDPESNFNNSNAQGLEYGSAPTTRNMGVNLNVKF